MHVSESFSVLDVEVKLSLGFRMVYTKPYSTVTELLVRAHFTFLLVGNKDQRRLDQISIVGGSRN